MQEQRNKQTLVQIRPSRYSKIVVERKLAHTSHLLQQNESKIFVKQVQQVLNRYHQYRRMKKKKVEFYVLKQYQHKNCIHILKEPNKDRVPKVITPVNVIGVNAFLQQIAIVPQRRNTLGPVKFEKTRADTFVSTICLSVNIASSTSSQKRFSLFTFFFSPFFENHPHGCIG